MQGLLFPCALTFPAYLRIVCKVYQDFDKGSKLKEENYNTKTQKWLSIFRMDLVQSLASPKENSAWHFQGRP